MGKRLEVIDTPDNDGIHIYVYKDHTTVQLARYKWDINEYSDCPNDLHIYPKD